MKKLIIILIAILTLFILCACDITELSAPDDVNTTAQTTTIDETTDNTTKDETYGGVNHTACDYCGKLEGNDRWFIAKVTEDLMVMPIGDGCFESIASLGEGIYLSYKEVDGNPDVKLKLGDIIKVEYNGMIMESFPVQMIADSVVIIGYEEESNKTLSLADCLVERGNLSMILGDSSFYPIRGFSYSFTEEYDPETGMWTCCAADGEGVHSYLNAISNGNISDSDMPAISASGDFNLTVSGGGNISGYYVDVQTFKENTLDIQNISSLPNGEYYVVIRIDYGTSGYEYIFKLQITE